MEYGTLSRKYKRKKILEGEEEEDLKREQISKKQKIRKHKS